MRRIFKAFAVASLVAAPALANEPRTVKDPPPQEQVAKDERPTLEVAFVLDTTGSMGGLLESAKQKIWSIASRMASGKPTPRIRVGLVAYRDNGDSYVTQKFDLTEDLDAVYANLRTFQADGGGDTPEHVGKGLADAVSGMKWSQGKKVSKMIFVVGDAPSQHYQDGFDAKTWAKKAIGQGIVVNTVRCGGDPGTEAEFKELARIADGSYTSIAQEGGVVAVATPFDDEMAKLNAELAGKTIIAGTRAVRDESKRAAAEMAAMPAPAAADRIAYKSKAEGGSAGMGVALGSLGGGAIDLVASPGKLEGLKDAEMPEQLKAMKPEERKAFVEKTAAERKAIEQKLVKLSKDRDQWISKNAKTKRDSFDERVFEDVKASAAKVGVAY